MTDEELIEMVSNDKKNKKKKNKKVIKSSS
jgi:hypothetical protein